MPPKIKSEAEKLKARTQILDAARELVVSKGIEAVTMREIAKKIDYSPTTIYLYFADKDSLIQALCLTDFKTLGKELNSIMQIQAPVERMVALGSAYARFALSYPNHYRLIFMTTRTACMVNKNDIDPSFDAYQMLMNVVNNVYQAGYFLPELKEPELIAQTIWAGIHGVCSLEITMGNDQEITWAEINQRVHFMQSTLVRGLLKDTAILQR